MAELARVFVYGTLREGFDNPGREILDHHAELSGTGEVEGTLYDLGAFPALVEEATGGSVRGEVHELTMEPEVALERLDRYEGARGSDPLPYERVARTVNLDSGNELEAWVYVWTGEVGDAQAVPEGDWVEHVRETSG